MTTLDHPPTQTLIAVLNDHGMLGQTEIAVLAKHFPNLMVGVKMGASLRFMLPAADVQAEIDRRIARYPNDEYVREAFLPCNEYDRLRNAFGMPKDGAN